MDNGALRALALGINFEVHGVDATVTRPFPADDPITTRAIWCTPTTDGIPVSADFARQEPRKVLALKTVDVPSVPRGTRIVAPALGGGEDQGWIVDGVDRIEVEHGRYVVLPDPDFEAEDA